jgi:phosphoenolpyruvate synthase/pyruvate phosphate dikinase
VRNETVAQEYVLSLDDQRATLETVGGKGASLARLLRAGMPVPGGFHVTTAAYERFVAENDLMSGIRVALEKVDASKPDTLTKASAKIGALFLQAGMPEDEIRNRLKSGETRPYRLWLRMARVRAPSVPL